MNKYLASSANPEKLSATVHGILVALIPVVIFFGQMYGVELMNDELMKLVQLVTTVIASLEIAFGIVRKIYIRIENR